MRHTVDDVIWIQGKRYDLEDVKAVVPEYKLPDGFSHAEEHCGFAERYPGELKQIALPEDYKLLTAKVESKVAEIQAYANDKTAKEAADEARAIEASLTYKQRRAREYPEIGDQLDEILKYVNAVRLAKGDFENATTILGLKAALKSVFDLTEGLDKIVASWLAVKAKYPKEK